MKSIFKLLRKIIGKLNSSVKLFLYSLEYGKQLKIKNIFGYRIGNSTKIIIENPNSTITIGENMSCRQGAIIRAAKGEIVIGKNFFMNNYSSITSMNKIRIGNNCIFGENVKIYDHNHIFNNRDLITSQGFSVGEVEIGDNVWVGSNCVILKDVKIGNNVVIGAGSVIKNNIPSDTIVYPSSSVNMKNIIYRS